MVKQYLDCDIADGGEPPFEVSLSVDARVVSANHSGLVTIDAGYKSLSTDGGVAVVQRGAPETAFFRSEEHTSELQSLMRISYAVFCLKKKTTKQLNTIYNSS